MTSEDRRGHQPNSGHARTPIQRIQAPEDPLTGQGIAMNRYTVGWVCALPLEMAASKGMLDKVHPNLTEQSPDDHNTYLLGEVCGHNVVVACLPAGFYGIAPAATVATHMRRTFKSIRFGLMVGIGGGIPSKNHDIRLGDIVVGQPTGTNGGVIQHDRGRELEDQGFERTGMLNAPPPVLLGALSRLQADHLTDDSRVSEFLEDLPEKMKKRFGHPGASNDHLYLAQYPHIKDNPTCEQCDHSQAVKRENREGTEPVIHYGTIASGNQVIKDATLRDVIGKDLGALCFEMEAAGLQNFPSLVIRGICDYADSHKNKMWQFYAATTAAAFAKELLSVIPPSRVLQEDPIPQLVSIANESLNVSKQHLDVSSEAVGEQRRTNKILEARAIDLYIVHEACYDSEDVGSSPRCEANTRVRLQETIREWADDEEGQPFFWLVGPAGTGKSTLIRSVADSFHRDKRLVAGYFFKRGEQGRNNTNRLFSTLAIQLAEAIPSFKDSLRASVGDTDKDSIDKKELRFQFEKLIKNPVQDLQASNTAQGPRIIVLDALDECERPESLPRALEYISEICNKSTTLGFRVLLTSRPDPQIIGAIGPLEQIGIVRKLELHRVFSEDTKGDIRLYLQTNFMRIKTKANIQQDPWPSVTEVDRLVDLSTQPEPLFIYAATLLRFVYDEKRLQNPKNQLKIWIKQCENNKSQLHQMYNPILEQIFALGKDTDFNQQLQFLGVLVLTALPLSLTSLTSLLDLDVDDVNWWLPSLHAVLDIPSDSHKPLRLLHKSFSDFLLSEENPGHDQFRLDAREIHALLAHRCIEFMGRKLKRDICNLQKLDTTPQDINKDLLGRCIPFELEYSCRYWVYHLRASGQVASGQIACSQILAFLRQHFLHWLEVSALLGRTLRGETALRDLSHLIKSFKGSSELVDFLDDATRTVRFGGSIIESAPLQTYASLLLFSPVASRVRQYFWDQRLPAHGHIEGVKPNWDARVRTLDVSGSVSDLAFSPDGTLLASADSKVRVFNASTGSHLMTFEVDGAPRKVVFSHNNRLLAASYIIHPYWNVAVKVLDRTTGKELQTIKTSVFVINITFSPDDEVLALISADAIVEFWSVRSGILQKTRNFHTHGSILALSPSLEQLAIADDKIRLLSLVTDTVHHTFSIKKANVSAIAFSPDGGLLAAKCNKEVSVWNTASYALMFVMHNSESSDGLCFCYHSQFLASILFDKGVRIWSLSTGSYRDLELVDATAFAFSLDGQLLATSLRGNGLAVWDCAYLYREGNSSNARLLRNDVSDGRLLFSPNGELFASHVGRSVIQIWDSHTGRPVRSLAKGRHSNLFQFSPDSKQLASGPYSSGSWVWDVVDGTSQPMLESLGKGIKCPVVYSTNSQLASVCWDDNTLDLYDATSGSYLSSLQGHVDMICSLAFSPDGNLLALLSGYGTIQLWDTTTKTCRHTIQTPRLPYASGLKFSPDGKILAYHIRDAVYWWDIVTDLHQHTLGLEDRSYEEHGFSPNSSLLAVTFSELGSRSRHARICLYNAKTVNHQSTIFGHSGKAHEIVFSPDSSKVAVASSDRTVRLWDTTTSILLYVFDTYMDVPEMTRFSDNGCFIAVASRDKAIRLWNITTSAGDLHQKFYHRDGSIQDLKVLSKKVIVSVTDEEPDKLWDPWNTHTFKLSNHSYPISATKQTLASKRFFPEVSLDLSRNWVMRDEKRIIYIHPDYRPMSPLGEGNWITKGHTLVYLTSSGKVVYLRLPLEL